MNTSVTSLPSSLPSTRRPSALNAFAKRLVLAQLAGLNSGALTLREHGELQRFGELTICAHDETLKFGAFKGQSLLDVQIDVHDPHFYSAIAFGGSIGAAESYARGEWSSADLTDLVRLLLRNRAVLDGMETGLARLTSPLRKALHWWNRNTRAGSRRNIQAHYDLGNEFFALFLDETMMYSSAVFEAPGMDLQAAQLAKLDRICRKLELRPTDRLLEIGSGWGALAMHAASRYGCRVTTTTISPAQHQLACERIAAAGLSDLIDVQLTDYRDLTGAYDKIVSIEMIEAVGHQYYEAYFAQVSRLLKPDGMMLLQAITIADQQYESARRSVDFIQRYIFPGSTIPSVTALSAAITRASDLRMFHLEDIGPHYAQTLRLWRERFLENRTKVRELGYSEEFCRLWEFYFCYCEGGFLERALGDVQMLLVKPENRRAPLLQV